MEETSNLESRKPSLLKQDTLEFLEENARVKMIKSSSVSSASTTSSSISPDVDLIAHLASALDLDSELLKDEPTDTTISQDSKITRKENLLKILRNYLELRRSEERKVEAEASEIVDLNYQSDDEIEEENKQEEKENDDEEDELPRNLIVTSLPSQIFSDAQVKQQFEAIFRQVDHRCRFSYFRIFKRCSIEFEEPIAAIIARIELDGRLFLEQSLKMFLNKPIKLKNSMPFLKPPKNQKTFLISPPSSPPVGWEQILEDPPVVNYDLLAALSKLNPTEPCEIVKCNAEVPGIIIYPCEDPLETIDKKDRKYIQTRRPPINLD